MSDSEDQESREIIVVDSQRVNMIQNCAYKYNLTFNENIAPISKAEPLEKGSLMHDMLETYYKMRKFRSRWTLNGHRDKKKIISICERVANYKASKMDLSVEEIDVTFQVFKEYVEYYWDEPHETVAVEQVGSKVFYEDDELIIIYETKIDWIYTLPNIPLMPVDHKSSSRRGDVHDLSNQFIGYCWMLDVRNLLVNKIGFQSTVAPKDKFQRHIKSYPLPVIEEWQRNTIWWILHLRRLERSDKWPQNFTSCDKYSGCIFTPICKSAPEAREFKKRQLFQVGEEWDIGARL